MNDIRNLLREADPLVEESEPLHAARIRQREIILKAAAAESCMRNQSWLRMPVLVAAVLIAIVVVPIAFRFWSPFVRNVQAAVRFEVRLAERAPAPGLKEADSADGSKIYLYDEIIVNNSDIAHAEVKPQHNGPYFQVWVTLTPAGAQRMHDTTMKNIGKPMAILIDGEVIMAPVIRDALSEYAVIDGRLTEREAERIVAGILIR
jgi:preprotein translocase subunit SecD